jgi:hypothetical protein
MSTGTKRWWQRPWLWVSLVAVIVVAIVASLALGGRPAASPTPSAVVTPSTTASTSAEPTLSPSDTALTSETPYCLAFRTIIEGSRDDEAEGSGADWAKLEARFGQYLNKYQKAGKLAPSSLRGDYDKVITQLKAAVEVAKSRDISKLSDFFAGLDALNSSMDAIDTDSRTLCR